MRRKANVRKHLCGPFAYSVHYLFLLISNVVWKSQFVIGGCNIFTSHLVLWLQSLLSCSIAIIALASIPVFIAILVSITVAVTLAATFGAI